MAFVDKTYSVAEQAELYETGQNIVRSAPQLYIGIDVEADGYAGYGSMLALAGLSPFGETFYSEIKPITELHIPRQRAFCEEHGLKRERLLTDAPDVTSVMRSFNAWVTGLVTVYDKKPVITAWGADLDSSFIKLYYTLAGLHDEFPFATVPLDLKSLALSLEPTHDWTKTRKETVPEVLRPGGDFTHFAPDDVKYQQFSHFVLAALLARE